jgi:small subunit ribosomal protein S2
MSTLQENPVSLKDLLESGAHFGHQTSRWNPKMKRFIFESRNGLYIIDLAKTMQQIRTAIELIRKLIAKNKSILFVGTKKQAKQVVREHAEECGEFFVCERWLGGMLSNWTTIRQSVKKLERIEKQLETSQDKLTKKELIQLNKKREKLDKNLCGLRSMNKLPGLVFVVDPNREHIAVAEAKKLGIPVMALVDTNCDPDPIDYVIACNDDALKSVKLIVEAISKAVLEEKNKRNIPVQKGDVQDEKKSAKVEKTESEEKPKQDGQPEAKAEAGKE